MKIETFCTNCNATIEDGTKFCQECGTKVDDPLETEYSAIFCTNCGIETTSEFDFCPECGKSMNQDETGGSVAAVEMIEKKKATIPLNLKGKSLYIAIAVSLVLFISIIALMTGNKNKSGGNNIIYAKDKELQYTYLSKLKTFEMTDRLFDIPGVTDYYDYMDISDYILKSDNGRYMFYPDRIEDGVSYYWRDLKADNSKSDIAVKIDSDIKSQPFLTKDGSKLFYLKGDDSRLYVFDRKSGEKTKLDEGVESFYVNETGDYIIYNAYKDDEYSIYEMSMKGISGTKDKIDSNSETYEVLINEKKAFYLKEESLYLKEFGKEKLRISSDVDQIISVVEGKSLYYLKTEEVTNKLVDFINDDMAADDKVLEDPSLRVRAEEPQPSYPERSDYQTQVWYASSWGTEINPETNEKGYWQGETDQEAYEKAYEEYETAYDEWQDENNKIMDEYNEAYALYRSKESRDDLRAALEDEENAVTFDKYSLYYWNNGVENLVASDLASWNYYGYHIASSSEVPVVIYQKYNSSAGGAQKLSEIISDWGSYFYYNDVIWDLKDRLGASRNISDEICVASQEKESVIESNGASRWSISKDGSIYFIDDYDNDKGYGTLMSSAIKGGVIDKPVKIDEDVADFRVGNENGNYYYFKDMKNGSGDVYLNGKVIGTDVYVASLYNYKGTDKLIYYTDFSVNNNNGTLCVLNGGKETKIADDVSYFSPIDEKNISYLTDYSNSRYKGDLMLYNGGSRPTLVDTDVTALIWNSNMKWYGY